MFDTLLNNGEKVLVIWESGSPPECLKQFIEKCKTRIGDSGKLSVENVHRLSMASFSASQFDVVLSGVFPQPVSHNLELLGEVVRVLRPRGRLVLLEAVGSGGTAKSREKLLSLLTVSGLTRPSQVRTVSPPAEDMKRLQQHLQCVHLQLLEVHCNKPSYEVGSSAQLSFAGQTSQPGKISVAAAAVWRLDDTVDDDIETMDPDELLDEDDLRKPDPTSLRVCSTTGKRKACKNCSCGLAEELVTNNKPARATAPATSSCGNCYLGDAFRCASCPYLGMPAFKPGDKVALTDMQLKPDIL